MEENQNEKLLREIKPKFNFIYELLMPTGRKMKYALIMSIIAIVITIIVSANKSVLFETSYNVIGTLSLFDILIFFCYFMIIFSIIKLIVHIIFQKMQYDHISYKFYETYMVYEDDFLNQHKKNILYSNVKEVEIRRTIWDRIIGFGVIVIYTNAENRRNNGLVVYALDNPKEDYEFVDKLINKYRATNQNNNIVNKVQTQENITNVNVENIEQNVTEEVRKTQESEEAFKNSLKETN